MGIVPIETLIVPVLFALPPGSDRLLVMRVRPIPVTARAAGRFSSSDPGRWIPMLLAEEVPSAELASRVHPLLPRMMGRNRLAIPVWAAVRLREHASGQRHIDLELPEAALREMGMELDDYAFARQVLASVRGALAADPFAQRIVGDDARLGALSQEPLTQDPLDGLPAVVALLPEAFTLGELQQAIAATLGLPPGAMESSSSFRRRLQEFVHRRILRETHGTREATDADRIGRPPRHYTFNQHAWREWLMERGERMPQRGKGQGWEGTESFARMSPMSPVLNARMRSSDPEDSVDDPAIAAALRAAMDEAGRVYKRSAPRMAPPAPAPPASAPQPEGGSEESARIARLERMVESLARELGKKAEREG
jgi:hypothetical protein